MTRAASAAVVGFVIGVLALGCTAQRSAPVAENRPLLAPSISGIDGETTQRELGLRDQEDHPVTEDMRAAAYAQAGAAPPFTLPDEHGTMHSLADLSADKPLLIFFIEKECPCCLGAKGFIDQMAELYPDELAVVGIINADGNVADKWQEVSRPEFLVLRDPQQQVIAAYGAERGVYTTLVAPGGQIERAYPGYSVEMLQDLSTRIARLAGVEPRQFSSTNAPESMTSGCLFPEVNPS